MTNERQHPDSAAETDETVSATYRELSREGTPNYLNERVLQQASKKALRPRYARSIVWTRPLAWAATVGLCLAIVLEVTRVPTPEVVMTEDAIDFLEAGPPTSPVPEEAQAPAQAPLQAPVRQQPEALKDMKSQLGRSAAKQVADEPKREERMQDFAVEETTATAMPALLAVNECSDEVRVDPVSWLDCIADLEETDDTEAALRQREALKEAFPEFEMP